MTTLRHVKPRTGLDEVVGGAFKRRVSSWKNQIRPGDPKFPPERDRYHLYISYACPWAQRCYATILFKGLEDVITISIVHPTWQYTRPGQDEHIGWVFGDPSDPPLTNLNGYGAYSAEYSIPDFVNGAKCVRDLYELAGDTDGKYSVPILWDKKNKTIVNNESADIVQFFNSAFDEFAKYPDVDLYPEELRPQIEELNSWIYPCINDGVYRCGFSQTQDAYEKAFDELFNALDRAEELLSKQRFLTGARFTMADLRLFMTLIRFDPVYVVYFKTNKKRIDEYHNLFNYMKEIYQMPAVKPTVNLQHIKIHYLSSHPKLNYYGIIPKGKEVDLDAPHDRHRFPYEDYKKKR